MKMRPFFRWFALVISLVFVAFAALQWNDPDPIVWIVAYLVPAALCFLSFRGVVLRLPALAIGAAYFGAAFFVWPDTYLGLTLDKGYFHEIEEAREALGLAICSVVLLVVFSVGVKRK